MVMVMSNLSPDPKTALVRSAQLRGPESHTGRCPEHVMSIDVAGADGILKIHWRECSAIRHQF